MFRHSARAHSLVIGALGCLLVASPLNAATAADSDVSKRESTTPVVKITLSRSVATVGQLVTTKARVTHGVPGQKATLQKKNGKNWSGVATKRLPKSGRIKNVLFKTVPTAPGTYTYRVKLTAKGSAAAAKSKPKSVTVNASTPPPPPPPPHTPTPLKLNLNGATGLALPPSAAMQRGSTSKSPAHVASQSMAAGSTGSNLSVVTPTGQTHEAVVSGAANVQKFLIAPNGKVYLYFRTRVNLADTSIPTFGTGGCILAEVNPETGDPRCIDSTLMWINWPQGSITSNPPIQFDASGAIYYSGAANGGNTVFRRYQGGASTDLINDNISLTNFLVQPDGGVIASGRTMSTNAMWTRYFSPAGGVRSLLNTNSERGIRRFPDGNVYLFDGFDGFRVRRFLSATSLMDPKPWVASQWPAVDSYFPCPQNYSCSSMNLNNTAQTADGSVFAIDSFSSGTGAYQQQLLKIFPTVQPANLSTVRSINLLRSVGNHVLVSGVNADGASVLTRYDPSTGEETQLLGPDNAIELYHVNPIDGSTAWFDGLRFSDNRVVIGQINVTTGEVTIANTLGGKWEDFQTFSR